MFGGIHSRFENNNTVHSSNTCRSFKAFTSDLLMYTLRRIIYNGVIYLPISRMWHYIWYLLASLGCFLPIVWVGGNFHPSLDAWLLEFWVYMLGKPIVWLLTVKEIGCLPMGLFANQLTVRDRPLLGIPVDRLCSERTSHNYVWFLHL